MTEPTNLESFLRTEAEKGTLRFSVVGSIDDGKSTLVGRLLYDAGVLCEDHLAAAVGASRRRHFAGEVDFSLLTDGLKAEREQGITIDVAYRYFATPKRKFIIADTPGHEQYTRNMVTGCSTANLAVVLVDAILGVRQQTRRHAFLAALLGVPHLVFAVNKMDAVGYKEEVFGRIREELEDFATRLGVPDVRFLPISALVGDNVVTTTPAMPWYEGESLLELLEGIYIGSDLNLVDLRFPVQSVLRTSNGERVLAGRIVSGVLRPGDEVMVLPSGKYTRISRVSMAERELAEGFAPLSVAVSITDSIDVSRGDMLVRRHNAPRVSDRVEAMLVWLGDDPLRPESDYLVKHTSRLLRGRVDKALYRVDVNTLHRLPWAPLTANEIGRVHLSVSRPMFADVYHQVRETGSFILIDPDTRATVAAGMIIEREPALTGENEIRLNLAPAANGSGWQRARRFGREPFTVLLTSADAPWRAEVAVKLEERLTGRGVVSVAVREDVAVHLARGDADGQCEEAWNIRAATVLNEAGVAAICTADSAATAGDVDPLGFPGRLVHVAVPELPAGSSDQERRTALDDAATGVLATLEARRVI